MEALIDLMQRWVVDYGYPAIFLLMLAESACIPFPSEVTMLVAGWYSATGDLNFFWAGAWGVMGNLAGSLIAYGIGRTTGRGLLDRYGKYILIRSHDVDRAEIWWDKHGDAATFFSRLLPVIRTFISLPAGIARMPVGKFTLYTFLGVIPWTYALTYAGVVVEDNWEKVLDYFDIPTLIIGTLIVLTAAVWYVRRRRVKRGGLGRTAESERGGLGRTAESERGGLDRTAESERDGLGRTAESERGAPGVTVEKEAARGGTGSSGEADLGSDFLEPGDGQRQKIVERDTD